MFEQKASPDTTAPVIDVTLQNFMQEVIHASLKVPVAVYFWSPRSPACEQFGALLQKETSSYSGKLKLARVNVDEHPQIAQQFRIQGVPALYLFAQGQPVDGFMGILPEAQVKQFFSRLLGPADQETLIKEQIERAQQLLQEGKTEEAQEIFSAIHEALPQNVAAIAGLARCYLVQSKTAEAEALIKNLSVEAAKDPAIAGVKAMLGLAQNAGKTGDVSSLRAALEKNPSDHQARYDLANALFIAGQQEAAIEELLTIFSKDKNWNDQAARKQLLVFFEALGLMHPLSVQGRKRLSSQIFS